MSNYYNALKNEDVFIYNKYLAYALNFITGEQFYKFKDMRDNKEIYSFKNTKEFREALDEVLKIKEKTNKYI